MKDIKIEDGKLIISTSVDFMPDLIKAVTYIDITNDIIKALNLRIAECARNLEENIPNGVYSPDGNLVTYTKDGIRRHFSIFAYTEMQKAVSMLSNGDTIDTCSNTQHVQILKALSLMPADMFECCEKEIAVDIATEYLLSDRY